MDELGLTTLRDELVADCRVAEGAWGTAQKRFGEQTDAGLEGCAHHLARFYNVVEQMALRVARTFENRIEDASGWHAESVRRLSIPIRGVRPAFFSAELGQALRELRGFRHVFAHAYDLELDRDKMALLLKYAGQVGPALQPLCRSFVAQVASQEGLAGFEANE